MEEARALDRAAVEDFSIPSLVLMEHASRAVADVASQLVDSDERVLVLCGPGNNGGDGYGAARFLHSWGYEVTVLRLAHRAPAPHGDAGLEATLAAQEGLTLYDASSDPGFVLRGLGRQPGLIIDAIFGSGLARPLGAPWVDWIDVVNAFGGLRLSIDVPSGMDADSGQPFPVCIKAHVTATMVAPKLGFQVRPDLVGHVIEVDIGLPGALHRPYLA